ncbi:unnamed protein product [Linum tenue]|uniref:Uncharacterized protein n=1 Tax=Linum tenue TaxID=586396 RepID=A0AAV0M634_9ROSI|nr:unnamed protein product [Linum tenue]
MAELEYHSGSEDDDEGEDEEEEEEDKPQKQDFDPGAWFDILKHRLSSSPGKINPESSTNCTREFWTNEIIKLAGARVLQSRSPAQGIDVPHLLTGLTNEESKNVELMEYLLECAEHVGKGKFELALQVLDLCTRLSSQTGNPIQRVGYYFSSALRQRIELQKTRRGGGLEEEDDHHAAVTLPDKSVMEYRNSVPFYSASQLAAVQILMENLDGEKRIHVVELRICSGVMMIALMQALSSSPNSIEMLRITALAHDATEERFIHGSGRRLVGFARGIGLPFSFNVVRIWEPPSAAHKDKLGLEPREATVVLSQYALSRMVAKPNRLEAMMKLIRSIRPRVMVVIELEANHNAPDFGHRFVETLFTAGAYFDCLATCMEEKEEARAVMESWYLNDRIRNILVAEGEKRVVRDVKIGVWRKYFARFGMLEISVRGLGLQHANLMVRSSPFAGSYLVALDRKSLMIGWKDMPLLSVSAWKFMKAIPH